MAKKKASLLGIIAEDDSDVECIKILISRIKGKNIPIKKHVGEGCGRIHRKCLAWTRDLHLRGCDVLVVVHDLDRKNQKELRAALTTSLHGNPITAHLVCIPVEELEAWLLSDERAIKEVLSLPKQPLAIHHPEKIKSPKEHMERLVRKLSNGNRTYLHTKHNAMLSAKASIPSIRKKCPSFVGLAEFATQHIR